MVHRSRIFRSIISRFVKPKTITTTEKRTGTTSVNVTDLSTGGSITTTTSPTGGTTIVRRAPSGRIISDGGGGATTIPQQVLRDAKVFEAREQLKQEVQKTGTPFTRLGSERFLKRKLGGLAISELREATRRDRERFRRTGRSLREFIKEQSKKKLPKAKTKVVRTKKITPTTVAKGKFLKQLTQFNIRSEVGKKAEEIIVKLRQKALRLSPSFRREADQRLLETKKINNGFNRLSNDIQSFNKKFGEKELSESQFKSAESQSKILEKRIKGFDNLVSKTDKEQKKRLREEQGLGPFKPFTLGVISSPFSLVSFGVKLVTRPTKLVKEVIEGVGELPSRFKEAPVTTAGSLVGEVVGSGLIFKGLGSLRRLVSERALIKSGKSFIIEKPAKIKKTPFAKTFPEEFKLRINEGAIKSYAKSSLQKRGINFDKLNKIDQEFITGQIKAKIKSQPEKFIPKTRQIALKKAKVKNLRKLVRKKLEGRFDEPILFLKKPTAKSLKKLTKTQKITLQRLARQQELRRIKRVVKKRLRIKREIIPLSKSQLDFIKSKLRSRIKADPELILTKTQKKALKKAKTRSEIDRIRKAALKRLKGKEPKIALSQEQISLIRRRIKTTLKSQPLRFTPKARKIVLKKLQRIQERKAISRAKKKGREKIKIGDLISKQDKLTIVKRIKAQVRTQPEKFIPSVRGQALIQIQKPKIKTKELGIKIVSGKITPLQKLALRRLIKLDKKRIRINKQINKIEKQQLELNRNFKINRKQLQKQRGKIKLKQKQKQKITKRQKSEQVQRQKQFKRQKFKLKQLQRQKFMLKLKQRQQLNQVQKQKLETLQKFRLKEVVKSGTKLKLAQKQVISLKQLQRVKTIPKIKLKQIVKPKPKIKIKIKSRKKKRKKLPRRIIKSYSVFGKTRGKFIRLNKRPLSRKDALSRGAFAIDHSTATTYKIKPRRRVKKLGKISKGEKGYFSRTRRKYRGFKVRKGRKILLRKKFIERKGRPRIDTRGEVRGLKLAKFIKQRRLVNVPKGLMRKKKIKRRKVKGGRKR